MKFRELVMFILNFSPNKNVLLSNHIYDIISTSGSSISIDLQIKNQQTLMEENHAWKKKTSNFYLYDENLGFFGQETTLPP